MIVRKLWFVSLVVAAVAALGCGESGDGSGGAAGTGGSAGTGGTGGSAGAGGTAGSGGGVAPAESGLYSYLTPGTYACLFVSDDRTKLVADPSCYSVAFRFLTNRVGPCVINYPIEGDDPQEIPIVDGKFEVQANQTDGLGDYTVEFSGEFSETGGVTGMASHSRDCPEDQEWQMSPGCCSRCDWCQ